MKNIKIIASDMDGTFLKSHDHPEEHFIPEEYINKLKILKEKGVNFLFASGRAPYGMIRKIKDFNLDEIVDYIVSHNGGAIYDCNKKEFIHKELIPSEDVIGLCEYILKSDLNVSLAVNKWSNLYVINKLNEVKIEIDNNYMTLVNIDNVNQFPLDDIVKIMIFMEKGNMEKVEELIEKSGYGDKFNVSSAGSGILLELTKKGVTKATGLAKLSKLSNYNLDNIMAFGDAQNDIDMLKKVKIGIAMKNAQEEVLEISDMVTEEDNNNYGVLKKIFKLFEI